MTTPLSHSRFLAALAAALLLPSLGSAAPIAIANPSFESPGVPPVTFSGGMDYGPDNWTVYNTVAPNDSRYFGVWNPTGGDSYIDPIPDGTNVGVVFLLNSTNLAEAGLQQTLSAVLQFSTHYTLSVEVGNFDPGSGSAPWDFTGFPGYRVDLMAGNTVLASDNNTLAPAEGRFLTSNVSFTTGTSHALAGQALRIRLVNLNGPGVEVNFDRVRLDGTLVPEPSSAALAAFGILLVSLVRRRSI